VQASQALNEVVDIAAAHAEKVDAAGVFPDEAVTALRSSGLLGLVLPTEVGGQGAGPVEFTEVVAELAAACASTAMIYLMHTAAAVTVAAAPPRRRTRHAGGIGTRGSVGHLGV
jgi:alkylation response protein AidB-like acyl-CoA dehydrogenase